MSRLPRAAPLVLAVLALGLCAQSAWIPDPRRGAARPWVEPPAPPPLPELGAVAPLIGTPQRDLIEPDDTLLDVAHRHRLGFDRVARLNPDVHHWIPEPGTVVRLPTEHILPDAPREGLVVNIPEMQLYDYSAGPEPEVFAIAIGDEMDPSLLGEFRIGRKREHPAWNVPASIRAKRPELPAVVPPGPDNPLGDHWMTIGATSYGIHGTNNPWSIGREATHGCIRLYNDEIARLFARTAPRTRVRLLYQTVKIGRRGSVLYLEAHPDVYRREPEASERVGAAFQRLYELGLAEFVDPLLVRRAMEAQSGAPVPIGSLRGPEHLAAP
jgi:L,D-transpeptidase ErfK/SrfK